MNVKRARALFPRIVFAALLLVSGCAAPASRHEGVLADAVSSSAAGGVHGVLPADTREMIVPEPIFNGTVYITEAGMQHELSIVLVHGMGDRASRDWEQIIPGLAERYHVIAFDLPGFGRSSKGNDLYSPTRYSQFMQWVIDQYVTGPFVLIGHSMGGALALCYAAERPVGLQRLILVDAAGILNSGTYVKELLLMNEDLREDSAPGKLAEEIAEFLRFMVDDLMGEDGTKKFGRSLGHPSLRRILLGGDPKKIAAAALMVEDYGPIVDRIRAPSLLIWGGADRIAPLRTAHALAGRLPGTRLIIIPQAGHVPMRKHTEEFIRIVTADIESPQAATPQTPEEPRRPETLERIVRYERERGLVLTGNYKHIELVNCSNVTIRGVTAERINAEGCDIVIENSSIRGRDVALQVSKSEIIGTNITVEADTAILADQSHLDLAGSQIKGRKAAVASDDHDVLLFSICHSASPFYNGPLHGARRVTLQTPL
jgi:pimeloyl-ACP methyl ester carboxylesterase